MGHSQDQWGATSIRFVTETAAKLSFSCVNWVPIQIGWHKNISDMWRSNWTVDFHCSVIFTRVNRIETMYGRSRVNVKERTLLNLYVYAWSFIHCRFIYARTRVKKKKKRQWKSTFTVIVDRYPRCMCTEALSDTTSRPVECTIQHFQTDQICSVLLLLRSNSIISR